MTDYKWCDECATPRRKSRYEDDPGSCSTCDAPLTELPLRGKALVYGKFAASIAFILALVGVVFVAPVVWLVLNIGTTPLYATKTVEVTVTRHVGIIPTLAPVVLVWILIGVLYLGTVRGYLPRP